MTSKRKAPIATDSQQARKTHIATASQQARAEMAEANLKQDKETALALRRANGGKFVAKITEQGWLDALQALAAGNSIRNVTENMGITRSCLHSKAATDPAFGDALRAAMAMGTYAVLEDGIDAVKGGQHSTGSVERDKAILEAAKWWAARMNRGQFGDKVQIDQRTITINITKDDENDW